MKYMRRTPGYTWTDYKTNAQIAKELKITTNFGQITGIQRFLNVGNRVPADTQCNINLSQHSNMSTHLRDLRLANVPIAFWEEYAV